MSFAEELQGATRTQRATVTIERLTDGLRRNKAAPSSAAVIERLEKELADTRQQLAKLRLNFTSLAVQYAVLEQDWRRSRLTQGGKPPDNPNAGPEHRSE